MGPGVADLFGKGSRIAVVAIEFVCANKGIGYMSFYYREILFTDKMYAGLVVVMLLGVLLTKDLQWVEKRIMPWAE